MENKTENLRGGRYILETLIDARESRRFNCVVDDGKGTHMCLKVSFSWLRCLVRLSYLCVHFINATNKSVVPHRGYVLDMFWICPPLGRLVCTELAFGLRPALAW